MAVRTPRPAMRPNRWLERTAGQRCRPVPSALRAPAAAQPQRSASGIVQGYTSGPCFEVTL